MHRVALVALVGLALAAGSATAAGGEPSCTGAQLSGTFKAVPGSAGAGNITYRLVLRNVSNHRCDVTGLPQGRLLDKAGKSLPTHVQAAFPGALSAVLVRVGPGGRTVASARFSPDVPGTGEPAPGTVCERAAYWFRVTGQGGGTTKVRLTPATPVCEHGRLLFTAYGTT
jgi:hypothetical protein